MRFQTHSRLGLVRLGSGLIMLGASLCYVGVCHVWSVPVTLLTVCCGQTLRAAVWTSAGVGNATNLKKPSQKSYPARLMKSVS